MENENFSRIMEGLDEARRHLSGDNVPGIRVHIPAAYNTKAIRGKLGLTQAEFARRYHFSVGAVRDWEQGRRVPEAAIQAFLRVIAAEPAIVERVLENA